MWRGSAAEYRHERDNEVVCLECLAKRKDLCRGVENGVEGVVDAHDSRGRYAQMQREHERAEDEACELRRKMDEYRQQIREALEKRSKE